ncbi:hypothetical protein Mucpa_5198 [Mucilaginibacter paludis DSM 18603]|uniref:Uncharacterized protein n=1 Tax=Mucilaginibacter paludis DSM 18603 TaxID=714943 RepID=H1Y3B8_9SPHI|nr:hypothetical protein Mucpa_5198 [Mucilaginibacter paludis DSM 18603]
MLFKNKAFLSVLINKKKFKNDLMAFVLFNT